MQTQNALIITGPTTLGKTALACEVARIYDGEIVNGWVSPLYNILPIATCRTDFPDFMSGRTHMFHILNPSDPPMHPDDYVEGVRAATKQILDRRHFPIIEGSDPEYLNRLIARNDLACDIGSMIGLRWPQGTNVEDKVRTRLQKMLAMGLVEEVAEAARDGWRNSWVVWENIIPFNILMHVEGNIPLDTAVDRIAIEWVGYAYSHLRQLLELPDVNWIEHDPANVQDTVDQIQNLIK